MLLIAGLVAAFKFLLPKPHVPAPFDEEALTKTSGPAKTGSGAAKIDDKKPEEPLKIEAELIPAPRLAAELIPPPRPMPEAKISMELPKKAPPPDKETQKKLEMQVREVFRDDFRKSRPNEKAAFAEKLLKEALNTNDNVAVRFVLLRLARDLAVDSAVIRPAVRAIEEMNREYAIGDALAMKTQALIQVAKKRGVISSTRDTLQPIVEHARALAEDNIVAERFGDALELLAIAEKFARSLSKNTAARVHSRWQEVNEMAAEFPAVQKARDQLKQDADDPDANSIVGQFAALLLGNWEEGLSLLAKGSDAELKALAESELAMPTEGKAQLKLAEGWFKRAEKEKRVSAKKQLLQRAYYWYEKAHSLLSGLDKKIAETQLEKIDQMLPKPENPDFEKHWFAGLKAIRTRDYTTAFNQLDVAVKLAPDEPTRKRVQAYLSYAEHMRNGQQLLQGQEYEKAVAEFRLAASLFPRDAAAAYFLRLAIQKALNN